MNIVIIFVFINEFVEKKKQKKKKFIYFELISIHQRKIRFKIHSLTNTKQRILNTKSNLSIISKRNIFNDKLSKLAQREKKKSHKKLQKNKIKCKANIDLSVIQIL